MDDIDIGLNEVFGHKTKQGSSGSKDYLYNLKLSTGPLITGLLYHPILWVIMIARQIVEITPSISISKKPL